MIDKEEALKAQLLRQHPKNSTHILLLQQIIEQQTQAINDLMNRCQQLENNISFLTQDRYYLLVENNRLKKKLEQFQQAQTLQLQQFIPKRQDQNPNVSVLFEYSEVIEESQLEVVETLSPQNHQSSLELIEYISGQKKGPDNESCEGRTPILHQPIFREKSYRCSYTFKGLVRSFYIKLLSFPHYILKIIDVINLDYKHGEAEGIYLLSKYPDNQFMGDMMIEFLKGASEVTKSSDLVKHLNLFQLYDDILQSIFINKAKAFMDIPQKLDLQATKKSFFALANAFDLQMHTKDNFYEFYQQPNRRIPSNQSEYTYNVHDQISLNPRPKDSISYIQQQPRAPLFKIEYSVEHSCFCFTIREQKPVEQVLPQELQFTESHKSKSPKAFDQSKYDEQFQPSKNKHFIDVPSILSSPQELHSRQQSFSECSIELFKQAKYKNANLLKKSTESMLLSGYTSPRCSQEWLKVRDFRSSKQNYNGSNKPSAKKRWRDNEEGTVLNSLDFNRLQFLQEDVQYE